MRLYRRLKEVMPGHLKSLKKWYIQNSNITFPMTGILCILLMVTIINIFTTYSRIGLNQNIVDTDEYSETPYYQQLANLTSYEDPEDYVTYDENITDYSGGTGLDENHPFEITNPKQLEFIGTEDMYRLEDYMDGSNANAPKYVHGYTNYTIHHNNYYTTSIQWNGWTNQTIYYFHDSFTINNQTYQGIKRVRFSVNPGSGETIDAAITLNGEEVDASLSRSGNEYVFSFDCDFSVDDSIEVGISLSSTNRNTSWNINTFEITVKNNDLYYSNSVYVKYNKLYYKLMNSLDMEDVSYTPIGATRANRFEGVFDGDYHTIKNLTIANNDNLSSDRSYGLFGEAYDATIKNINLDNLNLSITSKSTYYNIFAGGIVGRASGNSKIYNIGVISGSVSYNGSVNQIGAIGSVAGMITLEDNKRPAVVNCYSFANVNATGNHGNLYIAGIVGNRDGCINGTQTNSMWHNEMIKGDTVVYLLSYYGKIVAPGFNYQFVYNGTRVDMDKSPCYCYYLYRNDNRDTNRNVDLTYAIMKSYEEMTSDGYKAHMNNYRYMAAYYLDFDTTPKDGKNNGYPEIAKWTVDNSRSLFPMLTEYTKKKVTKYDDFEFTEADAMTSFGKNNYIKVNLRNTENSSTTTIYLKIEDKDESVNDFVNQKIILPFNGKNVYHQKNDTFRIPVNFTKANVNGYHHQISGWKLTSVKQNGVTVNTNKDPANYNYVLREGTNSAAKDIGTIYAQGGYYLVPNGVTEVSFDTEWARVFYVSDRANEHVYDTLYKPQNGTNSTDRESKYGLVNGNGNNGNGKEPNTPIVGLYNAYSTANNNQFGNKSDGYSYMFVLVGNLHLDSMSCNNNSTCYQTYAQNTKDKSSYWPGNRSINATITSIDSDEDFEPDFSFYVHNYHDMDWPILRLDFVNTLGFAQVGTINGKLNEVTLRGGSLEVTETVVTDRIDLRHQHSNRLKLNGGYWNIYNIWGADSHDATNVKKYLYFGGNARAAYLNCGQETTATTSGVTTKIPTFVIAGGRIETLSATYFNAYVAVNNKVNFFVDGGYIDKFYTTLKAPLNKGAHVEINGSYINKYFSGGSSDYAVIKEGVSTIINNSRINEVYGGPEFGEIKGGSKLEIYNSKIDNVYGGGYGGTQTTEVDQTYNDSSCNTKGYTYTLRETCDNTNVGSYCLGKANSSGAYQTGFTAMVYSKGGCPCSVFARKYSTLSTATVDKVELDMSEDEITNDIYGGGNKGVVSNKVLMNLENVTVKKGSIYGGGVSNENETVQVIDGLTNNTAPSFISYTVDSETKYNYKTLIWSDDRSLNSSSRNYHNDTYMYSANVPNLGKVNGSIYMNLKNVTVAKSIYGGGNAAEVNADIHLNITGDETTVGDYIFGGGNEATVTGNIDTRISGGEYDTVFGAGNKGAVSGTATLTVQNDAKIDSVFGGGNEADATTTKIYYMSGTSESVYGGSNSTGTVTTSNVNIGLINPVEVDTGIAEESEEPEPEEPDDVILEVDKVEISKYEGTNDWNGIFRLQVKNNSTINDVAYFKIRLGLPSNNYDRMEYAWNGNYYSTITQRKSGNKLIVEFETTAPGWSNKYGANKGQTLNLVDPNGGQMPLRLIKNNATVRNSLIIDYYTLYGYDSNGNLVEVASRGNDPDYEAPVEPEEPEPEEPEEPENHEGSVGNINIGNVYGGNNAGGSTTSSNILTGGENTNVENIYGGGNQASTNKTTINVKNTIGIENVYGGGRLGVVNNNTNVTIDGSKLAGNVFGGGEGSAAVVLKGTDVKVYNKSDITGSVFAGGDAANTGDAALNNGTSKVTVLGGHIHGNVYGGANTAVIYGTGNVVVGSSNNNQTGRDEITIDGTVFGGGESSEAGSEDYHYDFVSVTTGIDINITGTEEKPVHIKGSVFGSGNAANSGGYSNITISGVGTREHPNLMKSVQRAQNVKILNSSLVLSGATDGPNIFSHYLYSMSRIDSLTIANNTSLYLEHDFNLVQEFNSMLINGSTETKAYARIEDGVVTKNVDNRIYSGASKSNSINIRDKEEEAGALYQDVNGMTYFGLYIADANGNVTEGIYDPSVQNGDVVSENIATYFKAGSYVRGRHKTNHDKSVDGFYSNFVDPETFEISTDYVPVTSEEFQYYEWAIGEQTTDYDIELIASKFATTGTGVIELPEYSTPNSYFQIIDFGGGALSPGVTLVDPNTIPRIADSEEEALEKFGLKMTSNSDGWITNGTSQFFYDGTDSTMSGTTMYNTDNSNTIPSLEFYLTHSRNIASEETLGTAVICMIAYVPIDEMTYQMVRININVNIRSIVDDKIGYDAAMTSGRKTEIFVNGNTNINSKSQLSTYYSLFSEGNEFIDGGYRFLESSYKFPINTRITMIDRSVEDYPVYYYYVVTEDNYDAPIIEDIYSRTNQKMDFYQYRLDSFVRMGSLSDDNTYSDEDANTNNYNSEANYTAEEYIFTFDFSEANITDSIPSAEIFFTYKKYDTRNTELSTYRFSANNSLYNIIYGGNARLELNLEEGHDLGYVGQELLMPMNIKYIESMVNGRKVSDTSFSQDKLGLKITLYNSDNNKLSGTSLLGTLFYINGQPYSANLDGSVRLKVSDNVVNVNTDILMDLSKSNLATDTYRMVVETFGSPDGLYFGQTEPFVVEKNIRIINEKYGLKSLIADANSVITGKTGLTSGNTNNIKFNIEYSSRFDDANIRVKLYRRDYEEKYQLTYHEVDLQDYVLTSLVKKQDNEYLVTQTPEEINEFNLVLKDNLMTGTYKVVFEIYNGDSYIDSVFNYIFIK